MPVAEYMVTAYIVVGSKAVPVSRFDPAANRRCCDNAIALWFDRHGRAVSADARRQA